MRIILVLFVLLGVAACAPIQKTRGNYLQSTDVGPILPGATQTEILNSLGSPTAKAVFDDNTWYYVGEKTSQTAFNRPAPESRSVYALKFSPDGLLETIEQIDGRGIDVSIAREVTPTRGKTTSASEQILGNIGRFNKSGATGTPEVPGT